MKEKEKETNLDELADKHTDAELDKTIKQNTNLQFEVDVLEHCTIFQDKIIQTQKKRIYNNNMTIGFLAGVLASTITLIYLNEER